MDAEGQKSHVCMWDFRHGNPGLVDFTFLSSYCSSNRGVGGHT